MAVGRRSGADDPLIEALEHIVVGEAGRKDDPVLAQSGDGAVADAADEFPTSGDRWNGGELHPELDDALAVSADLARPAGLALLAVPATVSGRGAGVADAAELR